MKKETKLAIFGAAVGDYCGSYWETTPNKPNSLGDAFPHGMPLGQYTDDTKMTCAIANAIMIADIASRDAINGDFLRSSAISEMRRIGRKYLGGYGGRFIEWLYSDDPKPYKSFGNGAIMRISPVGLYANSLDEAISLAECVTDVTHNNGYAIKAAKVVAGMVYYAKNNNSATKSDMVKFLKEISKKVKIDCFKETMSLDLESLHKKYEFDVSCQGTLPVALYCFLSSKNFDDCVRRCIYVGGDTDTIGAIACSMAAPFYGDEQVKEFLKIMPKLPKELDNILKVFSETYLC